MQPVGMPGHDGGDSYQPRDYGWILHRGPPMSKLEETFAYQLRLAGIDYKREYRAIVGRKYRFDFAVMDHKILIEIQGGIWGPGGHSTGKGIMRDQEKLNLAQLNGWRIFQISSEHIKSGLGLKWIQQAITQKEG